MDKKENEKDCENQMMSTVLIMLRKKERKKPWIIQYSCEIIYKDCRSAWNTSFCLIYMCVF